MYESEFKKNLNLGQATERAVVICPPIRQFALTPLTNIANGGAPRLIGPTGDPMASAIVTPDFMADRPGEHYGLEIKGKWRADETPVTGEREHGIGRRLLAAYLEWQRRLERKVLLIIDEGETGEILAASLDRLQQGEYLDSRDNQIHRRPRLYFGDKMDRGGMAFFGRSQFMVLYQRANAPDLPLFKNVKLPPTLPTAKTLGAVE